LRSVFPELKELRILLNLGTPFFADGVPMIPLSKAELARLGDLVIAKTFSEDELEPGQFDPQALAGTAFCADREIDEDHIVMCRDYETTRPPPWEGEWKNTTACFEDKEAGVYVECVEGYYQDFMMGKPEPDLAVVSNPGLGEMNRHTWHPVLEHLLHKRIPFLTTTQRNDTRVNHGAPGEPFDTRAFSDAMDESIPVMMMMEAYGAVLKGARIGPFPTSKRFWPGMFDISRKFSKLMLYEGLRPDAEPCELKMMSSDEVNWYETEVKKVNQITAKLDVTDPPILAEYLRQHAHLPPTLLEIDDYAQQMAAFQKPLSRCWMEGMKKIFLNDSELSVIENNGKELLSKAMEKHKKDPSKENKKGIDNLKIENAGPRLTASRSLKALSEGESLKIWDWTWIYRYGNGYFTGDLGTVDEREKREWPALADEPALAYQMHYTENNHHIDDHEDNGSFEDDEGDDNNNDNFEDDVGFEDDAGDDNNNDNFEDDVGDHGHDL